MSTRELNDRHTRDFHDLGLSRTTREGARLYSIRSRARAATHLRLEEKDAPAPALVIPLFNATGEAIGEVLRPDDPEVSDDGHPVKYVWPKDEPGRLYFPPPSLVNQSVWETRDVPLLFTDGVEKALLATQCGVTAIAALGMDLFENVEAKQGGQLWKLHPDLRRGVRLKGRKVYIAFDGGDTTENPNVILAEAHLARMLMDVGATLGKRNRAWEAKELFDLIDGFERELATPAGEGPQRPAPRPRSGR
jgi:hypothetical protein